WSRKKNPSQAMATPERVVPGMRAPSRNRPREDRRNPDAEGPVMRHSISNPRARQHSSTPTQPSEPTANGDGKVLKTALSLLKGGYWPVAIHPGQKRPIGNDWGRERWDESRLRSAFQRYPGAGVGIAFGPGRAPGGGWLIDLEGDGDRAAESLAVLLGGE